MGCRPVYKHLLYLAALLGCHAAFSAATTPPPPEQAPLLIAGEPLPETRILPIPVLEGHVWAIPSLLAGLKDADADTRARCCFLLGQIADHSVRDALVERLSDPDRTVREFAGMALVRMGDWRGNHAARAALEGNRWWVRFWAVEAVGRNLWSNALAPMLRDPDDLVRTLAREAQKREWEPVEAAVAYSGPVEASVDEVMLRFVDYLIAETDWWWHAGDYPQIIRGLETAIWLDPTYAEGFANAAYLYWSLGRTTEAIATYRRAVVTNPESWLPHWELGFYYFNAQSVSKRPSRTLFELESWAVRR